MRVPFDDLVLGDFAGRLTFDPARNVLYASFSTNGVAMYDVSDPFNPVQVGKFHFPSVTGHPMTSLQLWRGPGNYVYVSLMGWGVGVLDATSGATFSQGFKLGSPFKPPGIANAFADAPVTDVQYPPRSAVYVADGLGGVHCVQFKVFA